MKWNEIFEDVVLSETATAGATGAGNIAVCVGAKGGIGAGFDPNGDWGIYNSAKPKGKKKSGPGVIRRPK